MVKYAHEPDNATKAVKVRLLPDQQYSITQLDLFCSAIHRQTLYSVDVIENGNIHCECPSPALSVR